MKKKELITIILNTSCYYVIIRFITLLLLIFTETLDYTNYHYSSAITWFIIWFIAPIIIALFIARKIKTIFLKQIGVILIPTIILFTIASGYYNKKYWGYSYVRPSIFNEIKNASKVNFIKKIEKKSNSKHFKVSADYIINKDLTRKVNLYYNNIGRASLYFLDQEIEIEKFYSKKNELVIEKELINITDLILKNNSLIRYYDGHYKETSNRFHGVIVNFETNSSDSFYYIAITSGEVKNDHYPFYEFLIKSENHDTILKKQMYYFDLAGYEGDEYSNIAPVLEFIILTLIIMFNLIIYFFLFLKSKIL